MMLVSTLLLVQHEVCAPVVQQCLFVWPQAGRTDTAPAEPHATVALWFGSVTCEPGRLAPSQLYHATCPACQHVPGWVLFVSLSWGLYCLLFNMCCGSPDRSCSTRSSRIALFLCFLIPIQERR